jgi:hypothetical protein
VAGAGAREFHRRVQEILQRALQLRDRRDRGQVGEWRWPEDDWKRGWIGCCNVAFAPPRTDGWPILCYEREAPVYFPELSWSGGHELASGRGHPSHGRTRKVWGLNRTTRGARTQSVLVSILQTCRQQLRPVSSFLQKLICSP